MTLKTKVIFFAGLLAIGVGSYGGESKKSTSETANPPATTKSDTDVAGDKTGTGTKSSESDKTASETASSENKPQPNAPDDDMIDDAPASDGKGGGAQD